MPSLRPRTRALACAVALFATPAIAQQRSAGYPEEYYRAPEPSVERAYMMQLKEMDYEPPKRMASAAASNCVGGQAGGYPCSNVDLLAFLPLGDIGGGSGNDIWGWTDVLTGKEYALMGRTNGTAFVDVSDPENPVYLGDLPTQTTTSTWRDIKVYQNHAFIVSEAGGHGMQVFDLTQLRSVPTPPVVFVPTAHYPDFGNAHNIVLNEESGFAYAVGTGTCSGGLHMVNVQNPLAPIFAGCFGSDGYTHDAQCVIYRGPDATYVGHEICLGFNEDTLTVVDVTVKNAPVEISRTGYSNRQYTHQGWFTEDQRWVLMNDELDESRSGINTRTLVWNLSDLDAPFHAFSYNHGVAAIDHNLYIKGDFAFESNYRAGLRILSLSCIESGSLTEVGYFDIYPTSNAANFSGAWSNYVWYPSGIAVVSGIGEGLFVLRPNLTTPPGPPSGVNAVDTGSNRVDLDWADLPGVTSYSISRSANGCAGPFVDLATSPTSTYADTTVSGGITYGYIVRAAAPLGCPAACVEVAATGDCILAPSFAGAGSVVNTFGAGCALTVRWGDANGLCSSDVVYNVYRSTIQGFRPDASNRVAACLTGTTWTDTGVTNNRYYYVVRAEDRLAVGTGPCGGAEDQNGVELAATAVSDSMLSEYLDDAEVAPTVTLDAPWAVSGADAMSGMFSFRVHGDDANECAALTVPSFVPTAGSVLSYGHREQDIEDRWDGGTVELSSDGGVTWSRLTPSPNYPDTFDNRSSSCNNDNPRGGGVYTDDSNGFRAASVSLGTWAGQEVSVRFRFATDGRVDSTAWWIDAVRVTDVATGTCTSSAPWRLYRSTVPSVAPGWPSTVPLPLGPTSNIDAGWPRNVAAPSVEGDLGALLSPQPLLLYRLLDDMANPTGNRLRLVKSGPGDVTLSF